MVWPFLGLLFFLAGCAAGPRSALPGVSDFEEPATDTALPVDETQQGSTGSTESGSSGGLIDESEREKTLTYLKALSAARQSPGRRRLSTSPAQLKKLGETHGEAALGEIEGNTAQN